MRRLLFIEILLLGLGLGLSQASAAPMNNLAPISDVELAASAQMATPYADGRLSYYTEARAGNFADSASWSEGTTSDGFVSLARNLITVAAMGLVTAMVAVGVRSLWSMDPIRYPLRGGPV
jgi:hypothetical protein